MTSPAPLTPKVKLTTTAGQQPRAQEQYTCQAAFCRYSTLTIGLLEAAAACTTS